jgi:hypothetical protein
MVDLSSRTPPLKFIALSLYLICGYLEDKDPLSQALKEIQEETGLSKEMVKLLCIGKIDTNINKRLN